MNCGSLSIVSSGSSYMFIAGLHPQRPCHFARQVSARVSQNMWPSYLSHMIAAADEYRHLHRSDCRNRLIYVHTTSHIFSTCNISLGSLMLPTPEAGDFAELLLLYYNYRHTPAILVNSVSAFQSATKA